VPTSAGRDAAAVDVQTPSHRLKAAQTEKDLSIEGPAGAAGISAGMLPKLDYRTLLACFFAQRLTPRAFAPCAGATAEELLWVLEKKTTADARRKAACPANMQIIVFQTT
jgi:hypothetical protein